MTSIWDEHAVEKSLNLTYECCGMGASFLISNAVANRSEPTLASFGWETIVMILIWLFIIFGGLLFKGRPSFVRPKGFCGSLFYQKLGSGMFLRITVIEVTAVGLIILFYVVRFYAFYTLLEPYETKLQESFYPGSNGKARAAAFALEEVWYSMLLVQISLGAKNTFWYIVTGLPIERAAAYHEYHGYVMNLVLIGAWTSWAIGGLTTRTFSSQLCLCDVNPAAGVALLVFSTIQTIGALPYVRRKYWEFFYFPHIQLVFAVAWSAVIYNRKSVWIFFFAGVASWGGSDFPLRIYQKVMQTAKVMNLSTDGKIVKLTVSKSFPGSKTKTALGIKHSHWEAGSYVWLSVRGVSSYSWAKFHPITMSSPPINADGKSAKQFNLHIKSAGEGTWSGSLLKKVNEMIGANKKPEDLKVWIGGPNGTLSIKPEHCDRIILVVGGIGCTPAVAIAMDQHYKHLNKATNVPPVELLWVERSMDGFNAFKPELEEFAKSELIDVKLFCTNSGKSIEMTKPESLTTHGGIVASPGRPKFNELFRSSRDKVFNNQVATKVIGVYSCGPKAMMRDVRFEVQKASIDGVKFYLHEETYEI